MTIKFNVTGAERKALVKAIGEISEVAPKYLGMPTAAYQIDYFMVDKNGNLNFDDRADSEEVENLLEQLEKRGFTAENYRTAETIEVDKTAANEPLALTIEIPIENVSVGNLTKILEAKGGLIANALGISELPIVVGEDKVSFPWFTNCTADESKAYTHFISALCEMSRTQKRINAAEKTVDNEKYAFRCFLLRLGFIGAEFKDERKILLRNLTGSSAFKNGGATNEVSE